jgi:hypothetical protein
MEINNKKNDPFLYNACVSGKYRSAPEYAPV